MSLGWRKYSPEFRRDVLERMKSCDNVSALSRELGICRKMLYQWKDQAAAAARPVAGRPVIRPGGDDADDAAEAALRRKVQQLESLVARQSLEIEFFRGALQCIEERRRKREPTSAPGSTIRSKE